MEITRNANLEGLMTRDNIVQGYEKWTLRTESGLFYANIIKTEEWGFELFFAGKQYKNNIPMESKEEAVFRILNITRVLLENTLEEVSIMERTTMNEKGLE